MDMTEPVTTWHVGPDALRRWVDDFAGPATSASVEQHLLTCADCRAEVAELVPAAPLDSVWAGVLAEVETPRPSLAERLLRRLGMSSSDALVVASAVTMRVPWIAGMIAVLAFAVSSALYADTGGLALFLMAAPLIPIAGVAASYGPNADPAYEAVLVAPYSMIRLVLLRTTSVLVTSVPMAVVAGLFLPTSPSVAVAWLLPAAGFVAVVLTASTWVDSAHVATAVALGWVVTVAIAVQHGDPLVVLSPPALLGYATVAVVTGTVLTTRLLGSSPSWRLR
jgi:hypothetical protein